MKLSQSRSDKFFPHLSFDAYVNAAYPSLRVDSIYKDCIWLFGDGNQYIVTPDEVIICDTLGEAEEEFRGCKLLY